MLLLVDSGSSECRYGGAAVEAFGSQAEVIFEDFENSYSGRAEFLLQEWPSRRFVHYQWTYGSCSGCDTWESSEASHEDIVRQMKEEAVYFDTPELLRIYLLQRDSRNDEDGPPDAAEDSPVSRRMLLAFYAWLDVYLHRVRGLQPKGA